MIHISINNEIYVSSSTEMQQFLDTHRKAVVVFFRIRQGPCEMISPYLIDKSAHMKVDVVHVDYDESEQLREAYHINYVPTYLVVHNKWDNIVYREAGENVQIVEPLWKAKLMQEKLV